MNERERIETYHEVAGEAPWWKVPVELEAYRRWSSHIHVSQGLDMGILWVESDLGGHLGNLWNESLEGGL